MTLGQRIKERRTAAGITLDGLGETLGVSREAVRKWEAGLSSPKRPKLEAIAQKLQTTVIYLEFGLTGEMTLHEPSAIYNVSSAPKLHKYPLISEVQAGAWVDIVDNFAPGDAEEWVFTPRKAGKHAFWLRVCGDSMQPRFNPGDLILVDPDASADPGAFVVAKLTDSQEATFKKLSYDAGQWYLMPLNSQYKALSIDREGVRIIGRVVFHQPQGESL